MGSIQLDFHRLVHEYAGIDPAKVWAIVDRHIGELISTLEPLVPPDE